MDTAWIALIGTLFGGVVLKLIEAILARGGQKEDAATSMREELRKDSTELRAEIRAVEKELDQWKEKYFLLLQDYLDIKSEMAHKAPVQKPKEVDW